MPRKLTHEEQVAAIAKINPNIEVLGEVVNNYTKVRCLCKICGHKWDPRPYNLKKGSGCPVCAGKTKLSHSEQVRAITKINPNVEVLGRIVDNKTPVLCRCRICGGKWNPTPHDLKNGRGCPKCAKYSLLCHNYCNLYILVDDLEAPTLMKIGVSVEEVKRKRQVLKSAKRAGAGIEDLHIAKTCGGPTETMLALENVLHQTFSNYRINFTTKFDGSTEFFYYRPEVFATVEEALKKIIESP